MNAGKYNRLTPWIIGETHDGVRIHFPGLSPGHNALTDVLFHHCDPRKVSYELLFQPHRNKKEMKGAVGKVV